MDLKCYLDKVVINWLKTANIKEFSHICGDPFLEPNEFYLFLEDERGSFLSVTLYLDGITSPEVKFHNVETQINFDYQGDLSIIENMINVLYEYRNRKTSENEN